MANDYRKNPIFGEHKPVPNDPNYAKWTRPETMLGVPGVLTTELKDGWVAETWRCDHTATDLSGDPCPVCGEPL